MQKRDSFTVRIPPGVDTGSQVRVQGRGGAGLRGGVPPADGLQRGVGHRLDAEFDPEFVTLVQFLKIIQNRIGQGVRSGGDDHHPEIRECQDLFVKFAEFFRRGVGRGECLKIGDVGTVGMVAFSYIIASGRDLSGKVRSAMVQMSGPRAVFGAENTARAESVAVAVGTAQREINGDPLERLTVTLAEIFAEET